MKKIILTIFVLVVFSAVSLTADVHIQQKFHSDAFSMMGQNTPEKNEVQHMWIGDNKMASHGKDNSFIVDLNKKVMYMIMHQTKSYVEMTLPLDVSKYLPPQMAGMMKNLKITAAVTPTTESKKINQWTCTKYDININMMMMDMKQTWWATKDVPFDWKMYTDQMVQMIMPTMPMGDALAEFKKVEGFPIRNDMSMSMMGNEMKSYTEVTSITDESAPAGTYTVPEGYTKKDVMDMQMR
jgi:hypothetical protein